MKLKNYIYLDKLINKLFVKIIYFFSKVVRKTILPDHVQNIIIVKFLGIGSISRSISTISHLKIKFPNSKITFVTFKENESLMKITKIIDDYYLIDKKNFLTLLIDFLKLVFKLNKKNSILIDLEVHSYFAKIFCLLINSNLKLGFFVNSKDQFYDKSFLFEDDVFIEENYFKILNYFNCEPRDNVDTFSLLDLNDSSYTLKQKLNEINISETDKFFLININASELCEERKWDTSNFSSLIKNLLKINFKILLIGSLSEKKNIDHLMKNFQYFSDRLFNMAGKTSIGELFCILKYYKNVFVTCDTGPLHLANISKCATISLWGPGTPKSYAEYYENHKIFYKNVHCSPCIYIHTNAPCNGKNICMQDISVKEVLNECINLIKKI